MKIFKVRFILENGMEVNGFTEAETLAEAMKKIANTYPDITHLEWFYEEE